MLLEDTNPPKEKERTTITTLAPGADRLREISGVPTRAADAPETRG